MINPDDKKHDNYVSAPIVQTEHAVAKMIGWESPLLSSSAPSLMEQLMQHKDAAILEFIQAESVRDAAKNTVETDATIKALAEKKSDVLKYKELIDKAKTYFRDIREEISKGENSDIRIDQESTDWTGDEFLTLASVEWWARNKYNISITSPDSLTRNSPEPQKLPLATIEIEMDIKQNQDKQPKLRAQEKAIFDEIIRLGYIPKSLPKNKAGKPGVKFKVRTSLKENDLFTGITVFDRAWERLRKFGDIVDDVQVPSP
ncbi:hypothetical protein [Sulfurirhabdus autotrophica]|uniref:Uncharacterized protein n=1 Tax=Sulfurirhabdus autotrophica TaxID=1706046 RepID=A0A4R3Y4G4_9PROT|nr:hypothetical protein [Sulfurirhabdus autotrophica]TCV86656.1 hypothetical protein EDC63_10617 [Sulfurirhabdus autotrophica]